MGKRRLSELGTMGHLNKRINVGNDNLHAIRETIDRLTADSATDEVIREVTSIIDDLDETRYKALTARSEAFRKQGKICNAIKDAEEMIRIKPTSAQGYLLAGDLYIMQGRQLAAMRVLENGLAVLPKPCQQPLHERREAARRSSGIRKNFVAMFSRELITKIFVTVSDDDDNALFVCTLVSKHWRTSVLSIPELWITASNSEKPNAAFRLLPVVSKYLRMLDIGSYTEKFREKLINLTERDMFPSLTTLSIEYGQDVEGRTCYTALLKLVGAQLEDLVLDRQKADPSEDPVILEPILSTCVNLKRLVLLAPGTHIEYEIPETSHANHLKLEMLFLQAENENSVLEKLLPRCPHLRVINMMPDRSTLIQSLHQHCTYLQELIINDGSSSHATAFPALNKHKHRLQPAGLRRLVYYAEDKWSPDLRDLVPFVTKSKDTLKDLVLRMSSNDNNAMQQEHWDSLAIGPYPQLTSVDITWWGEAAGRPTGVGVSRILRQCSSLESVRIGVEHNVRVPDGFFVSLTASSQLLSLTVYSLMMSLGGLDQLFKYHVTSATPSTLEKVTLFQCSAMTDECLYAIAGLPALVELTIIGPFPFITQEGVTNFLKKLGCTQSLLYLTLSEMSYLNDDSVKTLEEVTGLNRVMFVSRLEVDASGEKHYCSSTRLRSPHYT